MTRPEHVLCENCCYFERAGEVGRCRRFPDYSAASPYPEDAWCGEFRAEWPCDVLDWNNPEQGAEIMRRNLLVSYRPEELE